MPRENRYFLPGHVWHITHRCHKKEFLLKFSKDKKHWRYPQDIVFMGVAKFIEFYNVIDPYWIRRLSLQAMGWNWRSVRYGFPIQQLWQKLAVLLMQGYHVLFIAEPASETGGIIQRVPQCRFCLAKA